MSFKSPLIRRTSRMRRSRILTLGAKIRHWEQGIPLQRIIPSQKTLTHRILRTQDIRYGYPRGLQRILVEPSSCRFGVGSAGRCASSDHRALCLCKLATEEFPAWSAHEAVAGESPFDPRVKVIHSVCVYSLEGRLLTPTARFREWAQTYGPIIGLKFGPANVVVLNNYKDVQE